MRDGDIAVDAQLAVLVQLAARWPCRSRAPRGRRRAIVQRGVDLLRVAPPSANVCDASGSLTLNFTVARTSCLRPGFSASRLVERGEDLRRLRLGRGRRGAAARARPPRPAPRRAASRRPRSPRSDRSCDRNSSFCDAITLPLIFSLPVVNSFIASALPCVMSRKSALGDLERAVRGGLARLDAAGAGLEIEHPRRAADLPLVDDADLARRARGSASRYSAITANTSAVVGVVVGRDAGGRRGAPRQPPPVRFCVSASTISGVSFFRKPSFCDAITSPEIFSLPVENSFIASAWPVAIAMKSASRHLERARAPCRRRPRSTAARRRRQIDRPRARRAPTA